MRYMTDDFINKDPRALLNTAKLAALSETAIPEKRYIAAVGNETLQIVAGCIFTLNGGGIFITGNVLLTASDLDSGSAFTVGKDYYIYICDNGSNQDEVYKISLNSTYPSGYSADTSRKIGGFHYGMNRHSTAALEPINESGAVRGNGWESAIFLGIVPRSVWTLSHRPKCSPEGMVYLASGVWVDIYLASDDGAGGVLSKYNGTPLTGSEGLNWYGFVERMLVSGKRLLTYSEFCMMAKGSPEGLAGDNSNAWSAGSGRQLAGYVDRAVSSIGCRDAVGNVWEWLDEFVVRTDQTGNGHSPSWGFDTASPFPGYGNIYEYYNASLVALLAGGSWGDGVDAGARAVGLTSYPWNVHASIGARGACDCL